MKLSTITKSLLLGVATASVLWVAPVRAGAVVSASPTTVEPNEDGTANDIDDGTVDDGEF